MNVLRLNTSPIKFKLIKETNHKSILAIITSQFRNLWYNNYAVPSSEYSKKIKNMSQPKVFELF